MKKLLLLLIAFALLIVCSACSNNNDNSSDSADSKEAMKTTDAGNSNDSKPITSEKTNGASSVNIEKVVTFGRYEQDNNLDNGAEPIEWIVLDVQNGKALLLSKYGLDSQPYNTENIDITWENCTLRAWLNNDFLSNAFNMEEQSFILTTDIDNSSSQGFDMYETSGGSNTKDKVFLLSYTEANRYLDVTTNDKSNQKSRVAPTEYAKSHGAVTRKNETADGSKSGWWWLRSPGSYQNYAIDVNSDGTFHSYNVDDGVTIVRPAIWVNLGSGIL